MTTHTAPADWKEVLAKRTARREANVLRLSPSVEKAAALVDAPVGPTSIDEERRCATFVISTPTPDRSEDVVSPRGVKLANYARNPVVYYDHGFSGIQVPIGKCEDASGQLAVVVTDDGIEATCYFAASVEGEQIFELVKQSVLRAASINLVPLTYSIRKDDGALGRPGQLPGPHGRPGMEIAEWELLEWSVVGIPDNPEAVRKILAGGKLAGEPICEPIRKSLLTACPKPEPRLLGKGFSPVLDGERESGPHEADESLLEHPAVKAFCRELCAVVGRAASLPNECEVWSPESGVTMPPTPDAGRRTSHSFGKQAAYSPPATVSADTAVVLELLTEFNALVNELRESLPRAGRRA